MKLNILELNESVNTVINTMECESSLRIVYSAILYFEVRCLTPFENRVKPSSSKSFVNSFISSKDLSCFATIAVK